MKEFVEKLIERLGEEVSIYYSGVAFGSERLNKIINEFADEYNNGWIPCSERLPEVFDNVLICTKEGGRAIGHRCPNQKPGRYYDLHSSAIDNVIAWQPLPEPYIPKQEEQKG